MRSPLTSVAFGILAVAALALNPTRAAAIPSQCDAITGNLVQNCGFEGGTSTSDQPLNWVFTPALTGSDSGVFASPHSGDFAYAFSGGGTSDDDEISQSLVTISGDTYAISFWLSPQSNPATSFSADFGGITLITLTNPSFVADPANNDYEQFTFDEVATADTELLAFIGHDALQYVGLDDVSVVNLGPTNSPVPEPGSLGLLATAYLSLLGWRHRKRHR